jgi:hypothetical protein
VTFGSLVGALFCASVCGMMGNEKAIWGEFTEIGGFDDIRPSLLPDSFTDSAAEAESFRPDMHILTFLYALLFYLTYWTRHTSPVVQERAGAGHFLSSLSKTSREFWIHDEIRRYREDSEVLISEWNGSR